MPKIVIDIQENTRRYLYNLANGRALPLGEKLPFELQAELVKAVVNGTPLDDIKAEINEQIKIDPYRLYAAIEIIDRHTGERSE